MKAISSFFRFIADPVFRFRMVVKRGYYYNHILSDKEYLKRLFFIRLGYPLNLENPKTFNEKLNWIKLYDRRPEYMTMVDKLEAKTYVSDIIGPEYIIPTLGVWNRFSDVDFDSLPDRFVLKCTHDSGGTVICRDKAGFDREKAREKIEKCLRTNFYYQAREWPYKKLKPRLIAEKYLEDSATHDLKDYKFFAFNGEVRAMYVASDRQEGKELKEDYFDAEYRPLNLKFGNHPNSETKPKKPAHFEEMKRLAEKLSENIPEIRVDFYEADGKVYFGELTLFHGAGIKTFDPKEWDEIFGSWIVLPSGDGK